MSQTKAQRKWYEKNKKLALRRARKWVKANPLKRKKFAREWARRKGLVAKIAVFSYYGKNKKPLCKWRGCSIDDLDMLSLDHIDDSGAKDRRKRYSRGGACFYIYLLNLRALPSGLQVLCHNHQWKKELMRRRRERL